MKSLLVAARLTVLGFFLLPLAILFSFPLQAKGATETNAITLSLANGSSLTFESIERDGAKLKCKSSSGVMEYDAETLSPEERAKYFPEIQPAPAPTPASSPVAETTNAAAAASPSANPEASPVATAAVVSKPTSLTIYAIWDPMMNPRTSEKEIREMMDNLVNQFGQGNAWYHPGIAFIYANPKRLELAASIAKEKGVSLGPIIATQPHSQGRWGWHNLKKDLRNFQWRMNTSHWEGYYTPSFFSDTNKPAPAFSDQTIGRDFQVPSPSRYAPLSREFFISETRRRAQEIRKVMEKYPGVITCINGLIEVELAVAASSTKQYPETADYLADYSPFAVKEFQDWLRHRGDYNDQVGLYAGQGAPESITGPLVEWKGKKYSPFYFDKSPDSHHGEGESFNKRFGTAFTTWNLKYWDTELFPKPITDVKFNPMPKSGEPGYTEGGFDAPRHPDRSPWWRAWSWDYFDEGKQYPPGNPSNPAFGFRQQEVAHFVRDMFDVMAETGLPREMLYAHQIPDEKVDGPRSLSGATPAWTGYLPKSGTVGVTSFGWMDPKLILQYANLTPDNHGWGIFEWHPLPHAAPDSMKLYDTALKELLIYSRNNCHHLFAGWWENKDSKSANRTIFPLNDSKFAEAIKTFMQSTPDNPPPMPTGVLQDKERNDHLIN